MANMAAIRGWQFENMRNMIVSYERIVTALTPTAATTYRDGGTGWTPTEVLCHLRDFEDIFIERARLTLDRDNPDLPFPDPDALAAERDYNAQDIADVMADWQAKRVQSLDLFTSIADDQWERSGLHPRRGPFTLNDQLLLSARHDVLHFEQLTRILAEKQIG